MTLTDKQKRAATIVVHNNAERIVEKVLIEGITNEQFISFVINTAQDTLKAEKRAEVVAALEVLRDAGGVTDATTVAELMEPVVVPEVE